ncbi:MAG: aspartyl/asparaginyl beta-hydroxylase domain-containing protein [Chitinophagales bacterium]|nr:aspartyl/asparaginyl beta-hydroxylase domain-containing protein [Chitinophagales bacterium]
MSSELIQEPLYFYLTGNWYKGKMPIYYDNSQLSIAKILEENYDSIKTEILDFYINHSDRILPNYIPNNYIEKDWKTLDLMSIMFKYKKNMKEFPQLMKVIEQIPDVITIKISILLPHTRIKGHFGDTNALIRTHFGIVIPGKYPELGIRVRTEDKCWEEGKAFSFCDVHRHTSWNYSDRKRIVLIIDTIHPYFRNKKRYISSGLLAAAYMKSAVTRFPITRKISKPITLFLHKLLIIPFYIIIWLQDNCNIYIAHFLQKLKFDQPKRNK